MRNGVNKGNSCNIHFLTQKMFVVADEANFDKIMKEVVKVCKKVEPDCTILL